MKIEVQRMDAAAGQASDLLKALANRHRLLILCQILDRERSVGEIAARVGLRGSAVSQHLALLRREGLVAARRSGQIIWYSVSSAPVREIVATLYRVFCASRRCRPARQNQTPRRFPAAG